MKKGWTKVPLGDLCRFERGTSAIMKTEAGPYPLVVTAGYRRNSLEYQFDDAAVCIPLVSSTGHGNAAIHRIHFQAGKFALANLLVAAIPFPSCPILPKFLWRYLSAVKDTKLVPLMQGTANVTLKEQDLHSVEIPCPPMDEQHRIVKHLDAIEVRLNEVRRLREEQELELQALTTSLHLAMSNGRCVQLGKLLYLDEKQMPIDSDGSYPQIGIRGFGMGLFKKPAVLGTDTAYRAFNVLRAGQFVMSQVKGWEGALGVAGEDYEGWFASPEYRTFTCIEGECDSGYLSHIVATPWFKDQLASATRGVGARRERVRPEVLLGLEMPFPDFEHQVKAARMIEKYVAGKSMSAQAAERMKALLPSLLDRIFNEQPTA